eukprot:4683018-Pleurochrysis_carterae.AAC.2
MGGLPVIQSGREQALSSDERMLVWLSGMSQMISQYCQRCRVDPAWPAVTAVQEPWHHTQMLFALPGMRVFLARSASGE